MSTLSILPATYDINYIIAKMMAAGILNHYGYSLEEDGYHLRYRAENFDAVQDILDNYQTSYANDVLREKVWEQVKTIRNTKETGLAPTPFGAVQNDDPSKVKILGMVQMAVLAKQAGEPFEEEFTLADNSVVLLDADEAIALGKAAGSYVSRLFAHARILRDQIEAATTVDELNAIDIQNGWPE